MNTELMFSSKTDLWSTPQALFDTINNEFNFTLDVCADRNNAKCVNYFTKDDDGLTKEWSGVCWMNPPYGRDIKLWMQKAYLESISERNVTVVCLVPARTDTNWWHTFAMKGSIRFLRGRLKFGTATNSAPFPSAIVIFNGKDS